jgi:hypothetical protein
MDRKPVDGEWVTLTQAASILRVSVDTLRRRLKRGELDAVQQPTRHGKTWHIWLEGISRRTDLLEEQDGQEEEISVDNDAVLELIKLVSQLRSENRTLAHRVGYLEGQLQQAKESMRQLAAGKAWQDSQSSDRAAG